MLIQQGEKQGDILVVDDEVINIDILVDLLQRAGYKVRAATNGKSALRSCEKRLPDLVLLDVMMPEMNGFKVCRLLHGEEKARGIPVIFISALNDPDDKVEGFAAGAVDFISKPFDPAEVLARVRAHIQIQQMQRELKKKNQELERLAVIDPLTGLFNRRRFLERVQHCFEASKRYQTLCSMVMIDIDNFKKFNDQFGHDAGDQVLQAVAKCIQGECREADTVARWGGEEFIILIPQTPLEGAMQIAERMREHIEDMSIDNIGTVTASFGVVCAMLGDSYEQVIKRADEALYQAKSAGRNRVNSG